MIIIKNDRDLDIMRPACAVASAVLNEVCAFIQPGVTTQEIDQFAAARMKHYGAKSAFLGYRKFPCHTCISVNEEVVHGMASTRQLCFGDIVSLDVGVVFNGFIGDTARTVAVGGCGVLAQRLMDITEKALYEGIAQAVPGNRVADISGAIQKYVEDNGFSVVREFVGHGVLFENCFCSDTKPGECTQKAQARGPTFPRIRNGSCLHLVKRSANYCNLSH